MKPRQVRRFVTEGLSFKINWDEDSVSVDYCVKNYPPIKVIPLGVSDRSLPHILTMNQLGRLMNSVGMSMQGLTGMAMYTLITLAPVCMPLRRYKTMRSYCSTIPLAILTQPTPHLRP
jgi:hypothetical protein